MGTHVTAAMEPRPVTHIPALRLPLPSGEAAAPRRRGGAGLSSVRSMTSAAREGRPTRLLCAWHSSLEQPAVVQEVQGRQRQLAGWLA